MLKRAAINIQAQTSGHAALSVAIYHEKCVQDCIAKLLEAKKEAARSWLKWATSEEENIPVKELFIKLAELDNLWIRTYRDYFRQYEAYRDYFKQILQGDKSVDECRKKVQEYQPKIEKLQKQMSKIDAKVKEKKLDELSVECGKMLSLQQKAKRDLREREANNNLFKYKTVRNAVKEVNEAQTKLHERGFEISQTQHLLLDFYTATTYTSITPQIIDIAKSNGDILLQELEEKLKFENYSGKSNEGERQLLEVPLNPEEIAEYCPIPEMENAKEIETRPLPPLPPDDAEDYVYATETDTADTDPTYRPIPANPSYTHDMSSNSTDLSQVAPARSNNGVPVPQQRTSIGNIDTTKKKAPPVPPRNSLPNVGGYADMKGNIEYLEMVDATDMKRNTVYEGGTDGNTSSYSSLADAYSDKQSSSQTSAADGGISRGESLKSNSSQQDADDAIYDFAGDDDVHMRIGDVTRNEQEDVYEL